MPRKGLIVLLVIASSILGSTQTPHLLKDRIAKADPRKYQAVPDGRDWKNPYLVVRRDGIEIVGITEAGRGIPFAAVLAKLENLPDTAWPYGLVVALQDNSLRSEGDDSKIKANRKAIVRMLTKIGVTVDPWPS